MKDLIEVLTFMIVGLAITCSIMLGIRTMMERTNEPTDEATITVEPTATPEPTEEPVITKYFAHGRYYDGGIIVTDDGHEWCYDPEPDEEAFNNMPCYIGFKDIGTPYDITDDIILGIVLDRTTLVVDRLEEAMNDKFNVERLDDRNIHISIKEEK